MAHTPGSWDIHEANDRNEAFYITHKNRRSIGSISNSFFETDERGRSTGEETLVVNNGLVAVCPCSIEDGDEYTSAEDEANARLIAAAPTMLDAIETAGRIVGQVQDNPKMSAGERAYALSRACDALGETYFKTTGRPLEWWR